MQSIKKIYLYLVSVIALVIWVIGGIILINMALKTWVFPKADQNYYSYPAVYDEAYCQEMETSGKPLPECEPGYVEKQRQADKDNQAAQKQRDAAQALAMILVAAPVWFFHWRLAKRES